MNSDTTPAIRRILVALDVTPESEGAMAAAVELAALMRSTLTGLFVEDIDLLHMAALPFTREVRFHGAGSHEIGVERLESEMRARAAVARRTLETLTRKRQVEWSFSVVRGRAGAALCETCEQTDLIAVSRSAGIQSSLGRLGSAARMAATAAASAMLVSGVRPVPLNPLIVPFDGSPATARALRLALSIAGSDDLRLEVLACGANADAAAGAARKARELAGAAPVTVHTMGDCDAVMERLLKYSSGLIVAHRSAPFVEDDFLRLLADATCPVLALRDGS